MENQTPQHVHQKDAGNNEIAADPAMASLAPPAFQLMASSTAEDGPGAPSGAGTAVSEGPEATSELATDGPDKMLGHGGKTPANVQVSYSVPLDKNNIQASAGETMIFGVIAEDKAASGDVFETEYSLKGQGSFTAPGRGAKKVTKNGLSTRNVYMFTDALWKKGTITVTGIIRNKTNPKDEVTITWTVILRKGPKPKGLKKVNGPAATAWSVAPAIFTYQATPDLKKDGKADYEGQTVLEAFDTVEPLGFTMADLKPSWKAANPAQNTTAKVARYLWNTSGNGTFVFNSNDRIADRHGGFGTTSPFTAKALTGTGVGYRKPQKYKCGNTVIGKCDIDRRYTSTKGAEIKKSDPA